MPRDLSFRQPPSLAVAENANTPVASIGSEIWSTVSNKKLVWNGSAWVDAMGVSITVSTTAPPNPVLNQLWLDIS